MIKDQEIAHLHFRFPYANQKCPDVLGAAITECKMRRFVAMSDLPVLTPVGTAQMVIGELKLTLVWTKS